MKYQVELPLPPAKLSANNRGHTRFKSGVVRNYRQTCAAYILNAKRGQKWPELKTPIKVSFEFYLCKPKFGKPYMPRDAFNAATCVKQPVDALQDAGIVPNDNANFVSVGEIKLFSQAKDHQGRTCLVMILEPAE